MFTRFKKWFKKVVESRLISADDICLWDLLIKDFSSALAWKIELRRYLSAPTPFNRARFWFSLGFRTREMMALLFYQGFRLTTIGLQSRYKVDQLFTNLIYVEEDRILSQWIAWNIALRAHLERRASQTHSAKALKLRRQLEKGFWMPQVIEEMRRTTHNIREAVV